MQLLLEQVGRLPAADADAVRRVVGPESLQDIARAPALGWMPIEHDLACTRAVSLRLGARRTHDFYSALGEVVCQSPPIETLIGAARRTAHDEPIGALALIPRAKSLLVRAAGRWSVTLHGPAAAMIQAEDVPEALARDAVWAQGKASEIAAWMATAGLRGAVTVHEASVGQRSLSFRFRRG